jgi:hypothetical protein
MTGWIYSRLEPLIQSAITNRILKFHQAMIDREQIPAPPVAANPSAPLKIRYQRRQQSLDRLTGAFDRAQKR